MVKDLPRELWLEIFKHFIVSFGVMELYKYRKVCKVWFELIIVILIDKLTSMITKIKYYYQIIRGSIKEEIKSNSSPPPSPSPSSHSSTQQTMNNFITYNYNTESFECNFITTLNNDKSEEGKKKENIKKKYSEFCIIFHLIYEILNVDSIKRIREYLIHNYWLNIEEDIIDDDSKYFQKIIVRGDKLLPYIDYIDQINDLICYFNNLTTAQ
ncbi:hypothetical protein RhiirA5_503115 [Rhizophagus irregularis]|uniref:F-box domain-containing protein n=4 Tax=Rhizophagus irregularis TaxID=588596 RepID=A0A2I1F193_9GLOM|nr:hypothetical protein GLOIN_2v1877089 [Rhizophagus irregularis DAOM 181602=DAOM 197198]EXX75219.1 hypothetical protein RirG_043640 [Rhizophagus irregularis DAOM 197198w]PKC03913.1 hypothetical protein RhiirA5_503115 [Rhizophagus irregularis]PKC71461.1 hypothetical protein RhiirA1_531975 [Rhizophagus irregularis]PKY28150.1 hypothetical protein RhiirB3_473804 [Rhizophagus irregularis]PKY43943.1 hypothetical protein RhiirA4_541478 [Rhizophagus irregularis]|eukprot:XP_025176822.1 hypothetical protein GLOIN_2v1877089 [Rhizophagus irregularis DAOM 181602=DAOM 197198]